MKKYIILCTTIFLFGCNQAEKEAAKQHDIERMAAEDARIAQWAYIAKEKQITSVENIKLVIIPSNMKVDFFDTKCFIYTNSEYKTAQMLCPDADKNMISEGVE